MKTRSLSVAMSSSLVLALALALALGLVRPTTALAAPAGARARMPERDLDALRREIAQARAADARPFAEVGRIVARATEMNALARARRAPIALYIAKLGPSALMPALELLAVAPPRALQEASVPDVRRELIEAVGRLRDPRALPVLFPLLDDAAEDAATTRATTEAIARIGTDAAADKLLAALAAASTDRARALVASMGECRRLRVTEAIALRLRTTTDEATARAAARALGRAGNAWSWPTFADRREEARIRETAARALVDAFVRHDGDVRSAASNALMVVDAPETPVLLAEARKTASAETARALDALAARFARNPARPVR